MKRIRPYLSLILLFFPALLFILLVLIYRDEAFMEVKSVFPYFPWQFYVLGIAGIVATTGGVLDWKFHRDPLQMKIPKKERDAEAAALGLGGLPMFVLMWLAMASSKPSLFIIPIVIVLIYTVVAISYDEFVFHRKRCGKKENMYHRLLVFGNGLAWLSWFHFIYV